jgi:hypothetical protein
MIVQRLEVTLWDAAAQQNPQCIWWVAASALELENSSQSKQSAQCDPGGGEVTNGNQLHPEAAAASHWCTAHFLRFAKLA